MLRIISPSRQRLGLIRKQWFQFSTSKWIQSKKKPLKKSPPIPKILNIKQEDNPFQGKFKDEMTSEERWDAIQTIDADLTEGLSMILTDPELGVKGSLEIGKEFEKYKRMIKDITPPTKKALLIQHGIDSLMEEEQKRLEETAKAINVPVPKISCRIGNLLSVSSFRLVGICFFYVSFLLVSFSYFCFCEFFFFFFCFPLRNLVLFF